VNGNGEKRGPIAPQKTLNLLKGKGKVSSDRSEKRRWPGQTGTALSNEELKLTKGPRWTPGTRRCRKSSTWKTTSKKRVPAHALVFRGKTTSVQRFWDRGNNRGSPPQQHVQI